MPDTPEYPVEVRATYSPTIKIVHWLTVFLVVINIGTAIYMAPFDDSRAETEASAKLYWWSAYALLFLVLLHVSAVLKHEFFDKPRLKLLGRIT